MAGGGADALLPKLMSGELAVEKVEVGDACASRTGQVAGMGAAEINYHGMKPAMC